VALTRDEKADIIDDISAKLEEAPTVYLTNAKGLTVAESNDLRGRFFESDVEFAVVKNTLARIAMERAGNGGDFDDLKEHLTGPTAIAFSESPNAPARVIQNFHEQHAPEEEEEDGEPTRPTLKAAYVDGALYDADALDVLADLKSREELIGEVLTLLQSPIKNIVGALTAQGDQIAGLAEALAEREEE
jgi:large subunit ribosomal protein L10